MKENAIVQRNPPTGHGRNPKEEIDLLQIAIRIWQNRNALYCGMALSIFLGILYAFLASPVYLAEATISPKATSKGGGASSLLSQFGDIGGMIGMQLGVGANSSLDRMEIIVKGRELADSVINQNQMLPLLYPADWDAASGKWKAGKAEDMPTVRKGVEKLRDDNLVVSVNPKNSTLNLGIYFRDPKMACDLVNWYLAALNQKIRQDAQRDVDNNLRFFENQLAITSDPMLAEKIRQLMAMEIEKSMLLSSYSFDVLEKPVVPLIKSKPNRKLVVVLAAVLGALLSLVFIFVREVVRDYSLKSEKLRNESEPS